MSRRLVSALIALAALAVVTLAAQAPARPAAAVRTVAPASLYSQATEAWEAGRYPDALAMLLTLMKGPAADDYRDRVALLTGELFATTELTTDGRNPRLSPSGQYAAYETGPANGPVTRIVSLAGGAPKAVADVKGTGLVFGGSAAAMIDASGALVVIDPATGATRAVNTGTLQKASPFFGGNALYFLGADASDATRTDIYQVQENGVAVRVTAEPGFKSNPMADPTGSTAIYTVAAASPMRGAGGRGIGGGAASAPPSFGVVDLSAKTTRVRQGVQPAISANGQTLAWLVVNQADGLYTLNMSSATGAGAPTVVRTGRQRINAPALSPDGAKVAYEHMTGTDWEIYVSDAAGTHRRVTRDIQHDVLPRFLTSNTLLGMMGEARHRRSQFYDLAGSTRTRIFANDTVRTISPEYSWTPSADGTRLLVAAERDGDTVSVERGVYVIDLARKVSAADVVARLERQQTAETDLRARMTKAFAPIAALVAQVVAKASVSRVYQYEKTLFDFDSKYVSQPGNSKAIDYLARTYASFGYQPEVQWFSPAQAQGGRTGNVVSIKRGTEDPDLIYVVSSHFDSVANGPGADDNTSGTAALLEASRILADVPLAATVVFASFTGEEAGLLGSREFVRIAAERKWNVVGALNNDMIGWAAEGSRLDNTIRYSNAGIRDIQHGASFFTDLILYDAKYYKGTDANAFYDAWGDIVGGIGSYPILANPNYHQATDLIETMSFRQITETAKVTAATLVYLASSPSRVKGLTTDTTSGTTTITWTASPETSVRRYLVAYGPAGDPLRSRLAVTTPKATLPALPRGTQLAVKAVNARGLEAWDWARAETK